MQSPKRTRVTWCTACLRTGIRKDGDVLDETCRYCGEGEIRTRVYPSRKMAAKAHRVGYGFVRQGKMEGQIKVLKEGYGFIHGADNRDYFFVPSAVAGREFDSLQPWEEVSFTATKSERGPRAEGVIRRGDVSDM